MIEFRILGPLEVSREGREVALGPPKQRALLAVLLLHANEVVSADKLVDALWEEGPPADAQHSLQVLVSQLRAVLEVDRAHPTVLLTRAPGYVIRVEPDQLDLERFQRLADEGRQALADGQAYVASTKLREALAHWRGEPLADFAYERFPQTAIARLEEMHLAALGERIEAYLAMGRHAELVGELEQLVAEHPLVERLRGQLMLALYRCGRQADALQVYRDGRRILDDELGLPPSPALRRLETAILQQDPTLDLAEADYAAARGRPLRGERAAPERSILLMSLERADLDPLLALAEPMALSGLGRELILARLVREARDLERAVAELHERGAALAARQVPVRVGAFTASDPGDDGVRFARQQEVDLLLTGCPPAVLAEGAFAGSIAAVLENAPCDVGLLVGREREPPPGPVEVPFGGSEHDWAAFELGAWIASARGCSLRLLGTAASEEGERDASRLLATASILAQRYLGIAAEPLLLDPRSDGLLQATETAGLLVVGLSERWQREGLGQPRLALARLAAPPVLLVRKGLRPGGLAPPESLTRFTWSLSRAGAEAVAVPA